MQRSESEIVEGCWEAEVGGWYHKVGGCRRVVRMRRKGGRRVLRTQDTRRMSAGACTLARNSPRRIPRCWPRQEPSNV